jgi:integrase
MKHKLTAAFVAKPPLPESGRDRITYWEGNFGLMVTAKGHKSFVVQYRAGRVSRRMSLKDGLSLQEARKEADRIKGAVAKGGDPLGDRRKADGATLKAVAESYIKREAKNLRSADARERTLRRLVFPALGNRPVEQIKRGDIVRLLDDIEEGSGPHMAQAVLAFLSKLFNWYASRDDDFVPPIRRGMGRINQKESARDRTLNDDELRAVWEAAEATPGPYGPLVRFILLTATRCSEATAMVREELSGTDWIIPAARMKAKLEHVVPLSEAAKAIINEMPVIGQAVFTLNGRRPITNLHDYKAALDAASGVTNWRLHDLRRTARSLMSRAGIDADIAETCLAHTIGGIRGGYDRYAYHKEKKAAFEALATMVVRIINPADNIVPLRAV